MELWTLKFNAEKLVEVDLGDIRCFSTFVCYYTRTKWFTVHFLIFSVPIKPCQQADRISYLKRKCTEHSNHNNVTLHQLLEEKLLLIKHLIVDEKHKLLLCIPGKTGATSIKTLLIKFSDKYKKIAQMNGENASEILNEDLKHPHSVGIQKKYGFKTLDKYTQTEVKHILASFFKVIFVRHPFLRIYSMFKDKFGNKNITSCPPFESNVAKWILTSVRNVTANSDCVTDIRFDEYLKFLSLNPIVLAREPHVTPLVDKCLPCVIPYDFIGKLETSSSDQEKLINVLHKQDSSSATPKVQPLHLNKYTSRKNHNGILERINQTNFNWFMDTYHLDHVLFGYKTECKYSEVLSIQDIRTSCQMDTDFQCC